ncbi:MAG: hypothetical protein QOD06_1144 [Candidatus Binatota bacterium]|jgi:ubiquinone/menaquinone biosynthesis C-methylase UbiE|nr:hypothetical protein [Candidatus Binatota bacterium]
MSTYVPALGFRALTRFYDSFLKLFDEEPMRRALVRQAGVRPGHRVLDVGCGTGTLAIRLKQACPDAIVAGIDGDPDVLAIAHRKISQAHVGVELSRALADELPFPPASFDRVVTSLVFHHLPTDTKRRTLARVRECLRPGGELHVADWGEAEDRLMRFAFLGIQLLDGFATTSDNVRGRLMPLMSEAGFQSVTETHRARTPFGSFSFYRAVRP